jgi:hypothetical protein
MIRSQLISRFMGPIMILLIMVSMLAQPNAASATPIEWSTWFLIHPEIKANPGATVTPLWSKNQTHLDLFMVGTDGAVWSTWWDQPLSWRPWFLIHPEIKMQPGAFVTALWSKGETHLDIFVTGTDGAVWSTFWDQAQG